jgi:glutathione peroxidase
VRTTVCLFAGLLAFAATAVFVQAKGDTKVANVLDHKMKGLDGKEVDLSQYKGKVVMFVNVASYCGYTKQYPALEALHNKYKDQGFVLIGVPANEFGHQEPGTDAEIAKFCSDKYNVTFPMLSKVVVKGNGITPLYKELTSKETDPKFGGDIKWNFTKFLIGRNGEIVGRFESAVKPESEQINNAVQAELSKK